MADASQSDEQFWAMTQQRIARLRPDVIAAVLRFFEALRSSVDESDWTAAIANGGVDQLFRDVFSAALFARAFIPVRTGIRQSIARSFRYAVRDLPQGGRIDGVLSVAFDHLDPTVITSIRTLETSTLDVLETDVKETVRAFVENGIRSGEGPAAIARELRAVIGLAPNQELAVSNFESMLRAGDREALTRLLRDRRFDTTLRRAFGADGKGLTESQIQTMTDAYRRRFVAFNAETNSRTATLNAYKLGQRLAWQQAIDAGTVAADSLVDTWHTRLDGRERPAHHEMHLKTKSFTEQWIVPGIGPQDYPGQDEFNCVLPSTRLSAADGIVTTVRIFDGEAITLHTAAGHELSCTPNHPILTPRGWIGAGELREGDEVIHSIGPEWCLEHAADGEDVPPTIQDRTEAEFLGNDQVGLGQVVITPKDFHGDGADGQIAIVVADRRLLVELHAAPVEHVGELALPMGLREAGRVPRRRSLDASSDWINTPTPSLMRGGELPLALTGEHAAPLETLGVGLPASRNSMLGEDARDDVAADMQRLGESILAHAADVAVDQITLVERTNFRGHVYNLETLKGWYVAEGIITHNCRCVVFTRPRIRRASDMTHYHIAAGLA